MIQKSAYPGNFVLSHVSLTVSRIEGDRFFIAWEIPDSGEVQCSSFVPKVSDTVDDQAHQSVNISKKTTTKVRVLYLVLCIRKHFCGPTCLLKSR